MTKLWIAVGLGFTLAAPVYAQLPGIDAPAGAERDRDVSGRPIRETDDNPAPGNRGATNADGNAQPDSGSERSGAGEDPPATGTSGPGSGEGEIEGSGPISGAVAPGSRAGSHGHPSAGAAPGGSIGGGSGPAGH